MNNYLKQQLRQKILTAAPLIQDKLPDHPNHPHGRNAIAHIYHVMKSLFGVPVGEVGDGRFDDAVKIIDFCVAHPEEMHVVTALRSDIREEPREATLEDFM